MRRGGGGGGISTAALPLPHGLSGPASAAAYRWTFLCHDSQSWIGRPAGIRQPSYYTPIGPIGPLLNFGPCYPHGRHPYPQCLLCPSRPCYLRGPYAGGHGPTLQQFSGLGNLGCGHKGPGVRVPCTKVGTCKGRGHGQRKGRGLPTGYRIPSPLCQGHHRAERLEGERRKTDFGFLNWCTERGPNRVWLDRRRVTVWQWICVGSCFWLALLRPRTTPHKSGKGDTPVPFAPAPQHAGLGVDCTLCSPMSIFALSCTC